MRCGREGVSFDPSDPRLGWIRGTGARVQFSDLGQEQLVEVGFDFECPCPGFLLVRFRLGRSKTCGGSRTFVQLEEVGRFLFELLEFGDGCLRKWRAPLAHVK